MASSSSSSSSSAIRPQEKKYDVFVSFRGMETRDNFISHLHAALLRKKIHTFIDDRLERGDEISPALREAIMESKISVIIFSENFTSSTWCLEELVQILECKRSDGQIVIPVFYRVDPSHVRKKEGSYVAAFTDLEERFSDRGLTRTESKLIEEIVEDIMKKLNYKLSIRDVKGLVGIEERVKQIELLLCIDALDIRVIGIWGMGGIGKTTLACAVFNEFSYQFESSCFLANVREDSQKHGLNHLQGKLISVLFEDEVITSSSKGAFIKRRLHKKVFIILDDVDNPKQLEFLIGDPNDQFGQGSRIIVTTRDVQVLKNVAFEPYEVEELSRDEAYELFCFYAFEENSSISDDYITHVQRAIIYAQGLPLALKVLGSFLRSKNMKEWDSALDKLSTFPNMDIHQVLRVSYDGLDDDEKDIFLDIACFFKGYGVDFIERILEGCGFFPTIGIRSLIDKSLITVARNMLWMHDLLQDMGREIVRKQSIKEPGCCSRLWNNEEIYYVLKGNTGTATVEGMFLNTSEIKEVNLSPEVFSKMYKLRLLQIHCFGKDKESKLNFPQGLECLPDKLTYLHWDGCPLKSLPSRFSPENIVLLVMPYSKLEKLWDGIQDLGKLREMDLSYSQNLTQIPDLSHAPNLETINLQNCTSLVQLPSSFQYNYKLTSLNLRCCSQLENLPELSRTINVLGRSTIMRGSEIMNSPSSSLSQWRSLGRLKLLDVQDYKFTESLPRFKSFYWMSIGLILGVSSLLSPVGIFFSLGILIGICFLKSLKSFSHMVAQNWNVKLN